MGKFANTLKHIKLLEAMTYNDAVRIFKDEGVDPAGGNLKGAWRKLMRKYHPDSPTGGDTRKAQLINRAHDLLAGRTPQGRKARSPQQRPPRGGGYGARGAKAYRDTEEMGIPAWQTDQRSSYNKINRNDYTDVNFIKKDMWARSGKSKEEWTIWGHDGSFFRGVTTVFGNKKIFNDMAEAMRTWQSKGGNPYPTRAVFVSPKRSKKLYLVYLDGHFLGEDPYVMEHESHNANPSNDQSFAHSLPGEFDKISAQLSGKKTESKDVNETSSAGAVGAGAIASSVTGGDNRSGNKKKGKKKKAPTIFASVDPNTFEEIAIIRRRAGIEEAKFNIPDRPMGNDTMSLETWLRQIYAAYPEYNNPKLGGGDFMAMVKKFAGDDFYKAHQEARRYLALKKG